MRSVSDVQVSGPVLDYAPPAKREARTAQRLSRAVLSIGGLAAWCAATMGDASPSTSWEHHPFAGPFIILKESGSLGGYAIALFLLACILLPLAFWVWAGKLWGVL